MIEPANEDMAGALTFAQDIIDFTKSKMPEVFKL
jgi:hypothetical protein